MAFVTTVWMTIATVAEILATRGVKLFIHPSHNVPGDTTAHDRLDAALDPERAPADDDNPSQALLRV